MIKKNNFIDLFAGCGGLSEGFLASGYFAGLAHVEWEMPMVNTLRNRLVKNWNHSENESLKRVVHFDIQKTDELINGNWSQQTINDYGQTNHVDVVKNGLRGIIGRKKVDLIIGGPPCQAYSIAGRAQDKNSMKDDYRNYLFESFVKVVEEFQPSVFVFENVPGLLSACPGDKMVTERIYEAFSKIGYEIRNPHELKKSIYTASDFSVPQKRNRIIIVGVRRKDGLDLEELYAQIDSIKVGLNKRTVKDAIGNLPKLFPLENPLKVDGRNISHSQKSKIIIPQHIARYHNKNDVEVFRRWIIDHMNSHSNEEKIAFYNKLKGKNSNHAKYRNLEWDKFSPTIVAHLYKDGLMFIHPDSEQARSITIKEASLLQSFPADYEFIGSVGDCYKMIGNAVPPTMANYIAQAVYNFLNKLKK